MQIFGFGLAKLAKHYDMLATLFFAIFATAALASLWKAMRVLASGGILFAIPCEVSYCTGNDSQ